MVTKINEPTEELNLNVVNEIQSVSFSALKDKNRYFFQIKLNLIT